MTKVQEGLAETSRAECSDGLRKIVEILDAAGLRTSVVKNEQGGEFPDMAMLEKQEIPPDKMVRIFRGVGALDKSLTDQTPYAMRPFKDSEPVDSNELRQEVCNLAKNPTYENLIRYIEKAKFLLWPAEAEKLDADLFEIEESVLNGNSIRKGLIYEQTKHNGGSSDFGISPYVSASTNPYEAVGYGNSGLIIIDIPMSELEFYSADGGEVSIKGALDPKYISAVVSRDYVPGNGAIETERRNKELFEALKVMYDNSQVPVFDVEELRDKTLEHIKLQNTEDEKQWQNDVEMVRAKRAQRLLQNFPEANINFNELQKRAQEVGLDVYTLARRDVFDHYLERFNEVNVGIGVIKRPLSAYKFRRGLAGDDEKYDREKVDEIMLNEFKNLVGYIERKNAKK